MVSRIQRLTAYLSLKHLLFSFWASFPVAKKENKKTEEFIMRCWGQKVYFSGITCKDIMAMILFPLIRTHLNLLLAMPFVRRLASICFFMVRGNFIFLKAFKPKVVNNLKFEWKLIIIFCYTINIEGGRNQI